MGGALYNEPLVAVRELLQNAVDACLLRDQLTLLNPSGVEPSHVERIVVEYREPDHNHPFPQLTVSDTGVGMDALVLEQYFLKVGQSYYNSTDFNRIRLALRKKSLDFAPVSEFGIGFLSCFLVADRVAVDTAMWESPRGDNKRRVLDIHGPTRLIKLTVSDNCAPSRGVGTAVTMTLVRGVKADTKERPPSWQEVRDYIVRVCVDVPYPIVLRHVIAGRLDTETISQSGLTIAQDVPGWKDQGPAYETMIEDPDGRFQARIGVVGPILNYQDYDDDDDVRVIRGGFLVSNIPLVHSMADERHFCGTVRLLWTSAPDRRFMRPNLARESLVERAALARSLTRGLLRQLAEDVDRLPGGLISNGHWMFLDPAGERHTMLWGDLKGLASCVRGLDGYRLYRLAGNAWTGDGGRARRWAAWGTGSAPLSGLGLHPESDLGVLLLVLLFPGQFTWSRRNGLVFAPLPAGWAERLREQSEYEDALVQAYFGDYLGSIKDVVFYGEFPGPWFFNRRWEESVRRVFPEWQQLYEFWELCTGLNRIIEGASRTLTPNQAGVLSRAQATLGDLLIGRGRGRWPLRCFRADPIDNTTNSRTVEIVR